MDTFLQLPLDHSSWIPLPDEMVVPWTKITQNNLALLMHIYLLFSSTIVTTAFFILCDTAWSLVFELIFDFLIGRVQTQVSHCSSFSDQTIFHAHQFQALTLLYQVCEEQHSSV